MFSVKVFIYYGKCKHFAVIISGYTCMYMINFTLYSDCHFGSMNYEFYGKQAFKVQLEKEQGYRIKHGSHCTALKLMIAEFSKNKNPVLCSLS